jgi:hypothetical protein
MRTLLFLVAVLVATPAVAQTTQKYTKASGPPPGHTCADFYRSRDYGSLFSNLYESNQPSVAPQMYCPGEPGQPPAIAQPKERR